MSEAILYEVVDKVAKITFNRPEDRNSMNLEMLTQFNKSIESVKNENDVRCMIISGSGSTFSSGAHFDDNFNAGTHTGKERLPHEIFLDLYKSFLDLQKIEIPIIAAMNGHAIGGGLGLALICDIRIACKTAKYGANFARLGIHSGMGVSYMLPRLIGISKANEMLYTGRLISGEKAEQIGLASYAMDAGQTGEKAMELAKEIATCAPVAVRMMKRSIYRNLDWDPMKGAEYESHCQSRTFEMEDAKEGIAALLEKRQPIFIGK